MRKKYDESIMRTYRIDRKKYDKIKLICSTSGISITDIIEKTFDNVIVKYMKMQNEKIEKEEAAQV